MLRTTVAGFLFAAAIVAGAAQAAAADWSVSQTSGQVTITVFGAQPVALTRGAVLPQGGVLTTGPDSRAFLTRNEETIVVGPNAAIAIPAGSSDRQFTTVLQNSGIVEFTVEKQNVQHFSVETPYLAAVVKGTQFSVEVNPAGASVRVARGVVEVTSLATGTVDLLEAGQSATVGNDGSSSSDGTRAAAPQSKPRAPLVGNSLASLGAGARGGAALGGTSDSRGAAASAEAREVALAKPAGAADKAVDKVEKAADKAAGKTAEKTADNIFRGNSGNSDASIFADAGGVFGDAKANSGNGGGSDGGHRGLALGH